MGKLYRKRPGGTWYGDFYDPAGKRHQQCLRTKDERVARERLRQAELRATDPAAHRPTQGLADALVYLLDVAMAASPEATRSSYAQKARHVLRVLGDIPLNTVTRDLVSRYVSQRLGEQAHQNTVYKELVVVRRALKEAGARYDVPSVAEVVPQLKSGYRPRERYLSQSEFDRLILATPEKRRLYIRVAVYTSACDGELQRLRRGHVDLGEGWVRVPGTKRESRWRRVPIAEELRPHLEDRLAEIGGDDPLIERWSNVRRDLGVYCDRAGIDRVTPNDLRRTFASWLKQRGVDSLAVAQMMGHTSTRMVERVYGRLDEDTLRRAIDHLARAPEAPTPGPGNVSVTQNGAHEAILARLAQLQEMLRKQETPEFSGASVVPRDRVELPTRGFSVRVIDGGKARE